jgi:hypothetical protein
MDQDVFRQTYREVNERGCSFEKAVLTHQCDCAQAERFCIAEREGVRCGSARGHARCLRWLEILQVQVRFALRTQDPEMLRAHGKAIRIQVGGLRGLVEVLDASNAAGIPGSVASPATGSEPIAGTEPIAGMKNVDGLLAQTEQRYGDLDRVPFEAVIRQVQAYQGRVRSSRAWR